MKKEGEFENSTTSGSEIDALTHLDLTGTEGYADFFASPTIAAVSRKALLEAMESYSGTFPTEVIIEDAGGGSGFVLNVLVDTLATLGLKGQGILAEAQEQEILRNTHPQVAKMQGDITNQVVPDEGIHFVHARSVIQYFKTEASLKKFFAEVNRVLDPGGQFINVGAYFETSQKADLMEFIHSRVGKDLAFMTKEELINLHEQNFHSVVEAKEQIPYNPDDIYEEPNLVISDASLFNRYKTIIQSRGIDWEAFKEEVYEMVEKAKKENPDSMPGVAAYFVEKEDEKRFLFSITAPFLTLLCQKEVPPLAQSV